MAYITNKGVRKEYEILDIVRAGIALLGTEVKSIRNGKGSLTGAKVLIRDGEAYLVGASIPPHQEKNTSREYESDRTRRLLLTKREIQKIYTHTEGKRLTLIPLTVYNCNRLLKLDVGIAQKLSVRDKREKIKERESDRSVRRFLLKR